MPYRPVLRFPTAGQRGTSSIRTRMEGRRFAKRVVFYKQKRNVIHEWIGRAQEGRGPSGGGANIRQLANTTMRLHGVFSSGLYGQALLAESVG